jgi:hypothetical protein
MLNNSFHSLLKVKQISLKEKYSFFNHFFYRKTILKKILKISNYNIKYKIEDVDLQYTNQNIFDFYKSGVVLSNQSISSDTLDDFSIQRIRFKPGYQVT